MPPFIATTALLTGKIDAAALPEHYATLAESMSAKVLVRSQNLWSAMPGSGVVATEEFLKKHRDIVVRIVRILTKATKYMKDHPDEAARIVAKYLASDVGIISKSMPYLDYLTHINVREIQQYINYLVKYGVLRRNLSASEFIDLSILGGKS